MERAWLAFGVCACLTMACGDAATRAGATSHVARPSVRGTEGPAKPTPAERSVDELERSADPADRARAIDRLEAACKTDDAHACSKLADRLDRGVFVERDPARVVALREAACARGDGEACNQLGWQYYSGERVLMSSSKADDLWKRGCDQGHAYSCTRVSQNQRAFDLSLASCQAGSIDACMAADEFRVMSGVSGKVPDDRWKAVRAQLEGRCAKRDGSSCAQLAVLLQKGLGGQRGEDGQPRELLLRGCELGDVGSCSTQLYWERDPETIERLARRACDLGDGVACGQLAGLTADAGQALALRQRGCAFGDTKSCELAAKALDTNGDVAGARVMRSRECALTDAELCLTIAAAAEKAGDVQTAQLHFARACGYGKLTLGCGGELRQLARACTAGDTAACERRSQRIAALPDSKRDVVTWSCCHGGSDVPTTPAAAVIALSTAAHANDIAAVRAMIHPKLGLAVHNSSTFDSDSHTTNVRMKAQRPDLAALVETLTEEYDDLECDSANGTATCKYTDPIGFQASYEVEIDQGRAYVISIDAQSWGHS